MEYCRILRAASCTVALSLCILLMAVVGAVGQTPVVFPFVPDGYDWYYVGGGIVIVPFAYSFDTLPTPFGMLEQDLYPEFGHVLPLRFDGKADQTDAFEPLLLNVGGGNPEYEIRDRLATLAGAPAPLIGHVFDSFSGLKTGLVDQGLNSRLEQTNFGDGEFLLWAMEGFPADGRMMTCCIVRPADQQSSNGSRKVRVVDRVYLYIDSYDRATSTVNAIFVDKYSFFWIVVGISSP